MGGRRDLTGAAFGRLMVVRRNGTVGRDAMWECVCVCGARVTLRAGNLTNGRTRSCGCLTSEVTTAMNRARVRPLAARLRGRTRKTMSGCVEWTGQRDKNGYGRITEGGHSMPAHRAAYLAFVGPIPNGLWVLHRCDNPPCVNPEHLFIGDVLANHHDMDAKGRRITHRGSRNGAAKLTEWQVREIRALSERGESRASMATRYGMSVKAIGNVIARRTWRHVPGAT